MEKTIYFLPGHGGRIANGLGQAIRDRGYSVAGRETVGDFKKIDFSDQVGTIASDIASNFSDVDARIVANSYGAYLLLHALAEMKPFAGKVMLLSPIVGEFSNEEIRMGFIPPYSKRLLDIATAGNFPPLEQCEIHVGSEDWQSNPENVKQFATLLGLNVNEVKDAGHSLPKDYVSAQLDRWLG